MGGGSWWFNTCHGDPAASFYKMVVSTQGAYKMDPAGTKRNVSQPKTFPLGIPKANQTTSKHMETQKNTKACS